MTLAAGDLTTPARASQWMSTPPPANSPIISQLIGSMTAMIYSKLSRARTYSQTFTRTFDGVGNMQLVLPDFPVTAVSAVTIGSATIPASVIGGSSQGYGYRFVSWTGNLPGENAVLEFNNGYFYQGVQNVKVTYTAGYLIAKEPWTVPATPFQVTVLQPLGIWCRDNGVVYASSGVSLTPVASAPTTGQYIPPPDATPGLYTFSTGDTGAELLISYSFIPADLEEACNQMIAERYSYRSRVGDISKSLGGQETVRFARGSMGAPWNRTSSLPPEVMDLISPYISVVPPAIGAPV